jgi:hypothetical protein
MPSNVAVTVKEGTLSDRREMPFLQTPHIVDIPHNLILWEGDAMHARS